MQTIARQLAEILLRGMCEQSYWSPLEDPPTVSPLDNPTQQGLTYSKNYTLSRRPRVYSGEKYDMFIPLVGTNLEQSLCSSLTILIFFFLRFSLFSPQENTEEALLLLLISESMVKSFVELHF